MGLPWNRGAGGVLRLGERCRWSSGLLLYLYYLPVVYPLKLGRKPSRMKSSNEIIVEQVHEFAPDSIRQAHCSICEQLSAQHYAVAW